MSRPPPHQYSGGLLNSVRNARGQRETGSRSQQRANLPKPDGNLCTYSCYQCNSDKLPGYQFCLRHILSDKNAPFKPCGYCLDSQTGVKCSRPAPYYNRGDSYCAQHTRVILAARQTSRKRKTTTSILLDSLAPYKKSKTDQTGEASLNPFLQQREDPETEGLGIQALESNGIQVERDDRLVGETWTGGEAESEGESVDSDGEDPLQHAGVYTVEEVMRTLKDKLVKLQKLYIDQFQRLVYKMKESRREYLSQLRDEKEAGLINIFDQPNRDMEFDRLKAMMHYYSFSGREAILAAKHKEKRLAQSGLGAKQTTFCQHTLTTTTKCNLPCVPMAKFCMKHILEEPGQVLYRACGAVTPADGPCETPVASLLQDTTCVYHIKVPELDLRNKKEESSTVEQKETKSRRQQSSQQAVKADETFKLPSIGDPSSSQARSDHVKNTQFDRQTNTKAANMGSSFSKNIGGK